MLVSELKPAEEILASLRSGERVFVLSCGGCAEVCRAGGQEAVDELRARLAAGDHPVVAGVVLPFLCNKALVGLRLARWAEAMDEADSVLVASCGVGIQAVAEVVDLPVHPASNTITFGEFQGVWPSGERCNRCGDCVLDHTGGICPLTTCPKGLLHGPCGGSQGGECELEPGRSCGWQRIYDRLAERGRLDLLDRYVEPKDRKLQHDVPLSRRRSTWWDLEAMGEE
jgi:ferredoxin